MTDSLHVLFSDEGHPVAIRKWSKEPFDDAVEYVRKSDYADLIAACDAVLDWADANARWFDISTAPRDGRRIMVGGIQQKHKTVAEYWWYEEDAIFEDGKPCVHKTATHWMPIQNPPLGQLPAPIERLGEVLRKVKGAG